MWNFSIILLQYPLFHNTVVYKIKYQSLLYQMLFKDISPFLYNGIILAIFRLSGNIPVVIIWLMIKVNGLLIFF